jgi:hypothetical protein
MKKILFLAGIVLFNTSSFSQLGILKDKLLDKDPLGQVLKKKPPITTSLKDVNFKGHLDENFGNDSAYTDMSQLERTTTGGFMLKPGFFQYLAQSYCLKAGTYGPGGGDGYMYAPPLGKAEDAIVSILRNSVKHPEIEQQRIQGLLWAIIARAKVEDLSNEYKSVALQLLDAKQIAMLNRGAADLVPDAVMQQAISEAPPGVKEVLDAERNLRSMLTNPGVPYEQLERTAILVGNPPLGQNSMQVPSGRWSMHPDGYYVRYLPNGYTNTLVQIWVPQGSPNVGKEFDPATHIAVPGNTSRQRLIQSAREKKE